VRSAEKIEKIVKNLNLDIDTNAQTDHAILNELLDVQKKSMKQRSAFLLSNIRRFIVKSPITKLAAAIVIIIALALWVTIADRLASPAYAITDLPRLFEEARVVHIQGWQYFPGHRREDGSRISPQEINTWIDLENNRLRQRYTAFTGSWMDPGHAGIPRDHSHSTVHSDSVKILTREMIVNGEYRLDLNHTERNATFFRVSDYQQRFSVHHTFQQMQLDALGDVEQLENFEKVGWEEVDGIRYDIWLGQVIPSAPGQANRFKFWIRPDTKDLVRIQSWVRAKGGRWQLQYDYEMFRNIEVAQGIFAIQVPQGYTELNEKEQATGLLSPQDFSGSITAYQLGEYHLLLQTAISFTMGDGSVILAWSSADRKSRTPPGTFFEGIQLGGPLPKLPIEICGLKPAGTSSGVTYRGHHLAYTKKTDRLSEFTEWSLFVPDGKAPWSVKQLGYDVIYRFNLDHEPPWTITLKVPHGLLIKSAEDFNKWVLGAAAALSDDGKMSEHLTYENVLRLANQIRRLSICRAYMYHDGPFQGHESIQKNCRVGGGNGEMKNSSKVKEMSL